MAVDGGLALPRREGAGYRATVSHMGSRNNSVTNLMQMQSADMARYAPTTGAALVADRCGHAPPLELRPQVLCRCEVVARREHLL